MTTDPQHLLEAGTAFFGMLMAMSPGLQIRRMFQTRDSADVSIGYFCVLIVGFSFWVMYGLSIGSKVLWVCNIVSLAFGLGAVASALHFRRERRPSSPTLDQQGPT